MKIFIEKDWYNLFVVKKHDEGIIFSFSIVEFVKLSFNWTHMYHMIL